MDLRQRGASQDLRITLLAPWASTAGAAPAQILAIELAPEQPERIGVECAQQFDELAAGQMSRMSSPSLVAERMLE